MRLQRKMPALCGALAQDGGVALIDAGPFGTLRLACEEPVGAKLLLALRPEKIALAADGVPGADYES